MNLETTYKQALQAVLNGFIFFAGTLLRQLVDWTEKVETAAVNGTHLKINPEFWNSLSYKVRIFVLLHESAHLVLMHHLRRENRDVERWNRACDYAIHSLFRSMGIPFPEWVLYESRFNGLDAESIYRLLEKDDKAKTPNEIEGENKKAEFGKVEDAKGKDGKPLTDAEKKEAEAKQMQSNLQSQAMADKCGKGSQSMAREIDNLNQSKVNWSEAIAMLPTMLDESDFSFSSVNRPYLESGFGLPVMQNETLTENIVFAFDTSCSITKDEISQALTDAFALIDGYFDGAWSKSFLVIYCDEMINHVERYTLGDKPNPKGGGGTDFRPPFEYLAKKGIVPKAMIYFTDGECQSFPSVEPPYLVLWVLCRRNDRFAPPFGQVVRL